jgi:alpha-L-fucosidase 2
MPAAKSIGFFICTIRLIRALLIGMAATGSGIIHAQEMYAGRYKAVLTSPPQHVPTSKTPDGLLAGNGDIGLTLGGAPQQLTFYLGKNDFWRAYPVYPGGGIAFPGGLTVTIDALKDASYYAEQLMDKAVINGRFVKNDWQVNMNSWVSATSNHVIVEFTSTKTCLLKLNLWPAKGNTSINDAGRTNGIIWVSRSFQSTPLLEWPCHIAIAMKVLNGNVSSANTITLAPGRKIIIALTLYTNFDRENWKEAAISDASAMSLASISKLKEEHEYWWAKFWSRSYVQIGDSYLEKYYYASQYLLACASRGNKFAPGIWGPFITKDSTAWGGDYHLNYNYQAPYWACYSSNHIELTDNFDQPLLDYMEKGKVHAKTLLHVKGIYYPVGIGPKGLCTTKWPLTPEEMQERYGTNENTIDSGYKFLGQKINAVFSVGNMLMRFYSTYDSSYIRRVYPYMLECARFWQEYLKFEDDRYVIYMDHFNEVMPNLRNNGQWRNRLGDFNSTLSLGLVKMLFRGMIDASNFLQVNEEQQKKWIHIVDHLSRFPTGERDGRVSLKNMERGPQNRQVNPSGLNRVAIHGLILPGAVAGPETDSQFNKILLDDVEQWSRRMQGKGSWGNTFGNGIETCFPGAVRVGYDPDSILIYLKDRIAVQSYPNLFIVQDGGGIETLSAVPMTINEMLLQSYEGVVRIFPNWNRSTDASFEHLRAYGAFVISSSLKNGRVEYVKLVSEKARPCVLKNPWPGSEVQLFRNGKKAEQLKGGQLSFQTSTNEAIELEEL